MLIANLYGNMGVYDVTVGAYNGKRAWELFNKLYAKRQHWIDLFFEYTGRADC